MQLIKRDHSSGVILALVDTDVMTDHERTVVSGELHELIVEWRCREREASFISDRGIEAQLEYLIARRGEDALTDAILDALDVADKWRSWK